MQTETTKEVVSVDNGIVLVKYTTTTTDIKEEFMKFTADQLAENYNEGVDTPNVWADIAEGAIKLDKDFNHKLKKLNKI